MIEYTTAYLIRLSGLVRSIGELFEDDEIVSIGDGVMDLTVAPENEIIARIAYDVIAQSNIIRLSSKKSKPAFFRQNYDFSEVWPKVLDDYRDGKIKTIVDFVKKKNKSKRKASYLGPIDSYCASKETIDYWKQLLRADPSPAVIDFIKYIRDVSCGNLENK